jgi:tetrahydromethanopterin S-methyltransferase subunit D
MVGNQLLPTCKKTSFINVHKWGNDDGYAVTDGAGVVVYVDVDGVDGGDGGGGGGGARYYIIENVQMR